MQTSAARKRQKRDLNLENARLKNQNKVLMVQHEQLLRKVVLLQDELYRLELSPPTPTKQPNRGIISGQEGP